MQESDGKNGPLCGFAYDGKTARQAIAAIRQAAGESQRVQLSSFRTDGRGAPIAAAQAVSPDKEDASTQASASIALESAASPHNNAKAYRRHLPQSVQQRLQALDEEAVACQAVETGGQGETEPSAAQGESRFYRRFAARFKEGREYGRSLGSKLRIYLLVAALFGCYYAYNVYLKPAPDAAQTLQDSLPLIIDAHTTMREALVTKQNVTLFIEQDPQALGSLSSAERAAALDRIAANAPALCKNALLAQIIASGKSLTVLLRCTDGSYERRYSVTQCPTPPQS